MALELNLYLDVNRCGGSDCLLDSKTGTNAGANPNRVPGEIIKLRLWFRDISTGTSATVRMAAAALSFVSDYIPAAQCSAFSEVLSGGDYYYEATLALTTVTQALLDALASNTDQTVQWDFSGEAYGDTGLIYDFRVPVIFHKALGPVGAAVGPVIPAGVTFVISPSGDVWITVNGEPKQNLTNPGDPWH